MSAPFSNIELVRRVDSWPYFTDDPEAYRHHMLDYYYFMVEGYDRPFGYLHKHFLDEIEWPEFWQIDHTARTLRLTGGTDLQSRSRLMRETLRKNHESKKVPQLARWKNEDFAVYSSTREHVLDMDGSGMDVFGVLNDSVHMVGWVKTDEGVKIWVPRRALDKLSYAGMLDSTVGGSLATGEKPIDCMVRECEEEICLEPEYTRSNIKACGTNSYTLTVTDRLEPSCQHQVQYLYEIELAQDIIPKIGDGEVAELYLKSIPEVIEAMRNGEMKLNCNMVYLAFLIRHGYITAENEPHFVEICARLHRRHNMFII